MQQRRHERGPKASTGEQPEDGQQKHRGNQERAGFANAVDDDHHDERNKEYGE